MDNNPTEFHDQAEWDNMLLSFPAPHLLQSWHWGEFKARFGWSARRLAWRDGSGTTQAAAQMLNRYLRAPVPGGGLCLEYCPKGPVLDWSNSESRSLALRSLVKAARTSGAFVLKIDPEVAYGQTTPQRTDTGSAPPGNPGDPPPIGSAPAPKLPNSPGQSRAASSILPGAAVALERELQRSGWRRSGDKVQFRNTLLLDLRKDEDDLLAEMKQKWRYNVRLADRKGVVVRHGGHDDLDLLYHMYTQTAARDGFVIRTREYYLQAWESFMDAGLAQPLIAEYQGQPIAGQVIYRFGRTGWYLYGMSTDEHRELMPNHLLHWEAIRWAKQHGCETYDFVGAPDELQESDPMWGVYRFKLGFGGEFVRTVGAWDYPLQPAVYWAYRLLWPRVLGVMRIFGRRRVAAEAAS